MEAMYELLETQKLLESGAQVTFLPEGASGQLLAPLMASHALPTQQVPRVLRKGEGGHGSTE